ncbi:MAG TPA: serine/threonine-protein kinase [Polyangiaceae bacterium]|nr:serine/threonine-protein kinase [Polyangiaceae bacterium]
MLSFVPPVLAGKYRLTAELGRGGMGSVWRAEHLTLRSQVAIKLIDPELARHPEALERFLSEAQAAARLRSPHVVQVLDFGQDGAIPFIVMELLEGESLGARLDRSQVLTPADTARVLEQVARALDRAHEANIVHRDLKPDNIFIVRDRDSEVAKVLDFGIAKNGIATRAHNTRGGVMLGTPDYMSPEQIGASGDVDYRADIWAFGVIAYECLLGRRPFDQDSTEKIFHAVCTAPLPVPSQNGRVPPGFDAWFARACARSSWDRFASAGEAATELTRVCTAPPETTRAKHKKRARSRFLLSGLLGAGVLGALGLLAWYRFGRTPQTNSEQIVSAPLPPPALPPPSPPLTNPAPVVEVAPAPSVEEPVPAPASTHDGAPFTSITTCFRECDKPARECERSCKAPDCNVANTCFRVEAECDMSCYEQAISALKGSPDAECRERCDEIQRRCVTHTCGNSAICSRRKCVPLSRSCDQACPK